MTYRMIYVGLGALVVAAIALGIAFAPEGRQSGPEPPIEAVAPPAGSAVIPQSAVEVDLEIGYEATLYVDGFPVPSGEVVFVAGTGVHRWAPSPTSLVLDVWEPGRHTIRVEWVRIVDAPLTGSYEWSFRVQ